MTNKQEQVARITQPTLEGRATALFKVRWPEQSWEGEFTNRAYWRRLAALETIPTPEPSAALFAPVVDGSEDAVVAGLAKLLTQLGEDLAFSELTTGVEDANLVQQAADHLLSQQSEISRLSAELVEAGGEIELRRDQVRSAVDGAQPFWSGDYQSAVDRAFAAEAALNTAQAAELIYQRDLEQAYQQRDTAEAALGVAREWIKFSDDGKIIVITAPGVGAYAWLASKDSEIAPVIANAFAEALTGTGGKGQ